MLKASALSIVFLACTSLVGAQSLPFDFEDDIVTADFQNFDGGQAEVIANPFSDAENSSAMVARIIREGGEVWSGSKITLAQPLDFAFNTAIQMKVYTTAPVGTTVRLKLEGGDNFDNDAETTVSGAWETLIWDYTGEPLVYTDLVFMFDFGNYGDGTETSTFYFDDIEQVHLGDQVDLPVTFEGEWINYHMTDFEGNTSSLVEDPEDATNTVGKITRLESAIPWAGTTIGTPGGYASQIPFTNDETQMSVRIWSPTAGVNVRLKVETWDDPGQTVETETTTTVAEGWETVVFDFANEVPGTPSLAQAVASGWYLNKASIFFHFGLEGWQVGEKTFYIDDVYFGLPPMVNVNELPREEEVSVATLPNGNWEVTTGASLLEHCAVYNLSGALVYEVQGATQAAQLPAQDWPVGVYVVIVEGPNGVRSVKHTKH